MEPDLSPDATLAPFSVAGRIRREGPDGNCPGKWVFAASITLRTSSQGHVPVETFIVAPGHDTRAEAWAEGWRRVGVACGRVAP
jgi:hypothetical protein